MRKHRQPSWLMTIALLALLVGACSLSPPTPAPTSSVPLTPTHTPTPPSAPQDCERTPPPPLALVNGKLIDGTGAEPIGDAAVLIREGRISEVGRRDRVTIPSDAQVIDVAGRTMLPGFVNAHVHRAFEAENLAAWAQAGVTTVRDVGAGPASPPSWDEWMVTGDGGGDLPRPKIFDDRDTTLNRPEYARIVAGGPIVTVPRGYPIRAWGEEVALTVTSPEDARQRTAVLLDAGADLVKISLERGPMLSPEEVAAIVAVAHERDTLVTAHVSAAKRLAVGVDAGINDAAHMVTDRLPDELIDEMIARDVYVVPDAGRAGGLW